MAAYRFAAFRVVKSLYTGNWKYGTQYSSKKPTAVSIFIIQSRADRKPQALTYRQSFIDFGSQVIKQAINGNRLNFMSYGQ